MKRNREIQQAQLILTYYLKSIGVTHSLTGISKKEIGRLLSKPGAEPLEKKELNRFIIDQAKTLCPDIVEKVKKARSTRFLQQKRKRGKKKKETTANSKDFLESYAWRKLRLEALKLHGRKCQCCGATPESGAIMNVDHIKPRKFYPELALDINNLQVLCNECNHGKGNWDETDFRPKLSLVK